MLGVIAQDPTLRETFVDWEKQTPAMLASFRRDFAAAREDADAKGLIAELEGVSPEFKHWWRSQDLHAPCTETRTILVEGKSVAFEHTSLTVDGGQHLRLVIYARALPAVDA